MTLITTVPVLAVLIGLAVYFIWPNHKNLGLTILGCGLLVTMWMLAGHPIKL